MKTNEMNEANNEEFKKVLRVVVGDWDVNLVFRWEHGDWVCRMTNDFMEELQNESEEIK